MKTINLFYYSSICLVLFLISCSKDNSSNVVSSFPFTIEATYDENVLINTPERVVFKLLPEKEVESNTYSFSYEVVSGSGSFLSETIPITTNEFVPLSGLTFSYDFMANAVGDSEVKITVRDSFDKTQTVSLNFKVENNPFSVSFDAEFTKTFLLEPTTVELTVNNDGSDDTVTYERKLTFIEGEGTIFVKGSNQEVVQDVFDEVNQGLTKYDIQFSELGTATVKVTIRDSNGSTLERTIDFEIHQVNVSFSVNAQFEELFADETNAISFNVTEENGLGGTYRLKYIVNSGNVSMFFNNIPLNPDTNRDVTIGDFSYDAITNDLGEVSITFILTNQDGVTFEETIEYTSIQHELSFNIESNVSESYSNQAVPIDFSISEIPFPSPPYTLKFFSNGISVVTYNNVQYGPGEPINVLLEDFTLTYLGSSLGEHNIQFFITNDRQLEFSMGYNVTITESFEYSTFSENNLFGDSQLFEKASVTHVINSFDDSQSFEMTYELIEGGGNLYKNALIVLPENEPFEIFSGETTHGFWSDGNVPCTVRFTVTSSSGSVKESIVEFFPQ